MTEQVLERLTKALEILTKKEELQAKETEERMKRDEMWKKINKATQSLRDEKYKAIDALRAKNRLAEDKLHDEKETKIVAIENAIRKQYGEEPQKPYLRLQNAIKDYPCSAVTCR